METAFIHSFSSWSLPGRAASQRSMHRLANAKVLCASRRPRMRLSVGKQAGASDKTISTQQSSIMKEDLKESPKPPFSTNSQKRYQARSFEASIASGLASAFNVPYQSMEWLEILLSMPRSELFYRIKTRLVVATVISCLATSMHLHGNMIPELSKVPHECMGGALSVLNAISCGTANERFWDAHRLFSDLVYTSRRTVRLAAAYIPAHVEIKGRIARYVILFAYVLKDHLQGRCEMIKYDSLLTHLEKEEILHVEAKDRPMHVLLWLTSALASTSMHPATPSALPDHPSRLSKAHNFDVASVLTTADSRGISVGSQELVSRYPGINGPGQSHVELFAIESCVSELELILSRTDAIVPATPRVYTRTLSRFMSLWTFTLPFVLVHDLGIFTPLAILITSYVFFSIEELGSLIASPFKLNRRVDWGVSGGDECDYYKDSRLNIDKFVEQIHLDVTRIVKQFY
mmetsp:Transcript_16748/g.29331  ORF Transcript_16748/g.29331 Transcript_16748/m.29331 type:complete len:461 (-) Transcript_16748:164-1546(-)